MTTLAGLGALPIDPIACYGDWMQPGRSMSVSQLKSNLLEVVRRVRKGEVVEITDRGEAVAVLAPRATWDREVTGFARIEVRGDLDLPPDASSHDLENLRPKRRR